MKDFTNCYQLSKTLRFELKPIGKTFDFIQEKGLLKQDEQRAESYKKVKKLIDEYHKAFIEKCLETVFIPNKDIIEFESLFFKQEKDDKDKKELENLQKNLRTIIADSFRKSDNFKRLFGKELIKEDLLEFFKNEEELTLVGEFKDFTTYFIGFNENRKNMYDSDEKSTAIAYRLIHENLPKFLANKRTFDKIKTNYPKIIEDAKTIIEPELFGIPLEDMFSYKYVNQTFKQSDISLYNLMLGGKSDGNEKKQGLNELINLYRQTNELSKKDIPNLNVLYKQILSDRETFSFVSEKFENQNELLQSIQSFYTEQLLEWNNNDTTENVFLKLIQIIKEHENYDKSKMFLKNDIFITHISKQLFNDWSVIPTALKEQFYNTNPKLKQTETNDKKFEKIKFYSFFEIESALKDYCQDKDDFKGLYKDDILFSYFNNFKLKDKDNTLIENINQKYEEVETLLKTDYPENKSLISDDESIKKIKIFLDTLMDFLHFIKPLTAKGFIGEKEDAFYADFNVYFEQFENVTKIYDKVRNYLTQKPYSIEKYKLNFENSTLLDGWDQNKETANTSILFKKNGLYYLGVIDKKHNKVFENLIPENTDNYFEKIVYKLLPGASKMLPKVFFSSKNINYYCPDENILKIRNHGTHTKNGEPQKGYNKLDFNIIDCRNMVDFYKKSIEIHKDWKNFGFQFSPTDNYNSIDEFYREVENQGYTIAYQKISKKYIDELVNQGKLYLFQIYNKDFSPYSKGKPNLHTLYWKELFSDENLKDVVYKLNGQAEIFFRQKSLQYTDETLKKGHHYDKLKDKFDYPIISKKRFAFDKFQFHVPITLNFKAKGRDNINQNVLEYLKKTPKNDIHIIGIDRGERHLLYLSLIDINGNIKKQYTLNDIVNQYQGKTFATNYHNLLSEKEKSRADGRKEWKTIETIKELKEGYISQVVHQVAKMIVEHNAILIMEDLNFGFKKGRFKVEKQVYQKFEKMLIEKLNFYVDKNKKKTELGGTLKALQLTSKFTSFREMGKQSGFIFYVPAWNTSKIDPVTGFVNYFYSKYENIKKAQEFFIRFSNISWNNDKNFFEFVVNNYTAFNPKAEGTRQDWVICTQGIRLENFRNQEKNNEWDTKEIDLNNDFKALFNKFKIDFSHDLQAQIVNQTEKTFFENLYHLFRLTLQMRNSRTGTDEDYLISPIANDKGIFYDSRNYEKQENPVLPKDADANGAYNIARKGIILLDKIKKADLSKKVDLSQNNRDWLNFAQKIK